MTCNCVCGEQEEQADPGEQESEERLAAGVLLLRLLLLEVIKAFIVGVRGGIVLRFGIRLRKLWTFN